MNAVQIREIVGRTMRHATIYTLISKPSANTDGIELRNTPTKSRRGKNRTAKRTRRSSGELTVGLVRSMPDSRVCQHRAAKTAGYITAAASRIEKENTVR